MYDVIVIGSGPAGSAAAKTLADVKESMKINYFDDRALIDQQTLKYREQK